MHRLPPDVRSILASCGIANNDKLALAADKLLDVREPQVMSASADGNIPVLHSEMAELRKAINKLQLRDHRQRSRSMITEIDYL